MNTDLTTTSDSSELPSPNSDPKLAAQGSNPMSFTMPWAIASAVGIGLVLAGGVLHGKLSNRWGTPVDIKRIGEQLRQVPTEIGPWKSGEDQELPKSTITLLECEGYLNRSYTHQGTGEIVNVAVMFGPKGPIAVHTPEVCYSSRDVSTDSRRTATSAEYDGFKNKIWKLRFTTNSIDKSKLNVAYAWSDGGEWQAAEAPRFWRADYLYKLQTASPTLGSKEDSTQEFLRSFLPELRKVMTNEMNAF